jgi:hypothetical protein
MKEESEIVLVLRTLDVTPPVSLDWKLPVDIDSVEESRPLTNEDIDCRPCEYSAAQFAECGV